MGMLSVDTEITNESIIDKTFFIINHLIVCNVIILP
jgi:hypothetical protein